MSPPGARRTAACLAVAALAFAGCGDEDPQTKENTRQVRDVVTRFAESSGADACDLLTREAVFELYGGGGSAASVTTAEANTARDACREKARSFRGARVEIREVDVVGDRAAKVKALNPQGDREYNVLLRKTDEEDDWLIEQITQKAVPKT